jgi:ketosteroid isomerase-like protein
MTDATLDRIAVVARAWEAACRSLDSDRIVGCLAEEATVWYNFQPDQQHSPAEYRAILEHSKKTFYNQRYINMLVHLHPGGFVEQATLKGDTPNGVVETPFLLVATVKGDKITWIEEYFDTSIVQKTGARDGQTALRDRAPLQ